MRPEDLRLAFGFHRVIDAAGRVPVPNPRDLVTFFNSVGRGSSGEERELYSAVFRVVGQMVAAALGRLQEISLTGVALDVADFLGQLRYVESVGGAGVEKQTGAGRVVGSWGPDGGVLGLGVAKYM
jgi:hypothetical protein